MRFLFILCFQLLACLHLHAQQKEGNLTSSSDSIKHPLVFVDSFPTSLKGLIMDPQNIKSINVYKDTAAVNRYGKQARDGAILIQTKDQVSLLRLSGLYKKFNIPDSLTHYRVCINDVLVDDPRHILADIAQVSSIHTFTSVDRTDLNHPKSETLINIISRKNGL
jgi:hypothetical protein